MLWELNKNIQNVIFKYISELRLLFKLFDNALHFILFYYTNQWANLGNFSINNSNKKIGSKIVKNHTLTKTVKSIRHLLLLTVFSVVYLIVFTVCHYGTERLKSFDKK